MASGRRRPRRCDCIRQVRPLRILCLFILIPLLALNQLFNTATPQSVTHAAATNQLIYSDHAREPLGSNYSLRLALASGVPSGLYVRCEYRGRLGMWNGFPHIEKLLQRAGYEGRANGITTAATIVVPNYWRPGAPDWRTWHLAPWQRINRLWGMAAISRKESLVRTLDSYFGRGASSPQSSVCPPAAAPRPRAHKLPYAAALTSVRACIVRS